MTINRIVLVDPHITDEFFTPVRFYIKKRRGLKKYSYFTNIYDNPIIAFSYSNSGIVPKGVFSKLPRFLRVVLVYIEFILWNSLQTEKIVLSSLTDGDLAICALRNVDERCVHYIKSKKCKIAWLMSHFHIAEGNFKYVNKDDVILADNKNHFLDSIDNKIVFSPPSVKGRFKNKKLERSEQIISTGTIHLYSYKFSGSTKYNEYYTMHPSRADVYFSDSTIYNKNFSIIGDGDSLYRSQKGYMNQDIVEIYNNHRFAFIGSEFSGVFALGIVEAMCCGCEVFVEESIADSLGLKDGEHAWLFDGSAKGLELKYKEVIEGKLYLDDEQIDIFTEKFRHERLMIDIKGRLIG